MDYAYSGFIEILEFAKAAAVIEDYEMIEGYIQQIKEVAVKSKAVFYESLEKLGKSEKENNNG